MKEKGGLLLGARDRDAELLLGVDAERRARQVREDGFVLLVDDGLAIEG